MTQQEFIEFREGLLDRMVERARQSPLCASAALLGSAARQDMDAWSEIDLALRLRPDADLDQTSTDWTGWLKAQVTISDHFDIHAWGALYRVFLCDNGLQIDLSLWPWDKFRAIQRRADPTVVRRVSRR